ncbi:MAG: YxeA family protein [Oscillospiraceae bacterium]|jgi:uncharacterized protein (TIGR01655 family)|nr:YxeA family protein [Oscillospiraceae bacterium]
MKNSKKIVFAVLGILAAAAVILVAVKGRQYYADRYVSSDYYAMVPLDYDMTPVMHLTDDDDQEMGLGMDYKLTAYNGQGEAKEIEFTIMDKDTGWATAGEYVPPGTYLLVKSSKLLVNGWGIIEPSEIPAAALAKIEGTAP